jgi:hypothetical protein
MVSLVPFPRAWKYTRPNDSGPPGQARRGHSLCFERLAQGLLQDTRWLSSRLSAAGADKIAIKELVTDGNLDCTDEGIVS